MTRMAMGAPIPFPELGRIKTDDFMRARQEEGDQTGLRHREEQ